LRTWFQQTANRSHSKSVENDGKVQIYGSESRKVRVVCPAHTHEGAQRAYSVAAFILPRQYVEVFSQLQAPAVLSLAKTHPKATGRFSQEHYVEGEDIEKD